MNKTKHISLFFAFLLYFYTFSFSNEKNEAKIKQADALFAQKKYTESLNLYEEVFKMNPKASPNMLIKMAFVSEGLGNYTNTLYYLSLYYQYTPNDKTLQHMEDIAHTYRLKGYEHSDLDFIRVLYQRYFSFLATGLLFICIVGFVVLLYLYYNNKKITLRYKIPLLITLSVVFFLFRSTEEFSLGIVIQDKSYLMNAPSSGADLIKVIGKGHRVRVLDKQDVWYKILWNGQELFIKEINLRPIKP